MITEDYVSFETAKLLKEKNCPDFGCSCIYDSEGNKAQTQSIIMKWLREVHKIFITLLFIEDTNYFAYTIENLDTKKYLSTSKNISYNNYEQACEAAIKYCLENLI